MNYSKPARTTPRRIPKILVAGLLVVIAAIALGCQVLPSSSSTTASPTDAPRSEHSSSSSTSTAAARASSPTTVLRSEHRGASGQSDSALGPPGQYRGALGEVDGALPRSEHHGALGEADGVVPAGTTVFDNKVPGVTKLDRALLGALRQAATDAAGDGVAFYVNSGWRSPAYEEQLRREAIAEYGSEAEAARWVATGTTSLHVSGHAVDIGPADATSWLSAHGASYGLCQIYSNEPWHYELRPEAVDHGCPAMYADPTQDPRMQE